MNKRLILSTMLALCTALTMTTFTTVRADDEDVFVDEGDGDFDAVPPMPEATQEPAKETKPTAQKPARVEEPAAPSSAIDEAFEEAAPIADEETDEAPVAEPAPAPKKKAAAPAAPKAKAAKAVKAGKGKFVVTKAACPAVREPASSDQVFTTGASRKIWVEEVDANWVRGYNKAGEPGYISTDCVE